MTYTIRVDSQYLHEIKINNYEMIKDLQDNGLQILEYYYNSMGACYFFKVKGEYKGKIEFDKVD